MQSFSKFRNPIFCLTSRRWAVLAVGTALLLLLPSNLPAQGLSGITGTVSDPSGAVVPGAKVTVSNTATNISTSAVTTSAGTYTVTDLIPGHHIEDGSCH